MGYGSRGPVVGAVTGAANGGCGGEWGELRWWLQRLTLRLH